MKTKVHIFDKDLLKSYMAALSVISVITSFVFIFVSIPKQYTIIAGIAFAVLMIALYITSWISANRMKCIHLSINTSKAVVKIGDLHQEDGLKVIAFNEYFDTLVDEKVIASGSLHGKFINKYISDVSALDKEICENKHLINCRLEDNSSKTEGKTQKYKLGSIHVHKSYLLTAFTRFDEQNRAFLTMSDYIDCLLIFGMKLT